MRFPGRAGVALSIAALVVGCGAFTALPGGADAGPDAGGVRPDSSVPDGASGGGNDAQSTNVDGSVAIDAGGPRGVRCGDKICEVCCAGEAAAPQCADVNGGCGPKKTKITCSTAGDCTSGQICAATLSGNGLDVATVSCVAATGEGKPVCAASTNACPGGAACIDVQCSVPLQICGEDADYKCKK
jgi:hypothetical protein